jgi:hypothetical protein
MLETGLPAVFAVGDIRSGNVKRVASAVVKVQSRSTFQRLPNPLAHGRNVIRFTRVEMKWFLVWFDREAMGSPAIEAPFEKFDP